MTSEEEDFKCLGKEPLKTYDMQVSVFAFGGGIMSETSSSRDSVILYAVLPLYGLPVVEVCRTNIIVLSSRHWKTVKFNIKCNC